MYALSLLSELTLIIYKIEHGLNDYVLVGWSNENKKTKNKIYYSNRPYFRKNGKKYYLEDFMEVK